MWREPGLRGFRFPREVISVAMSPPATVPHHLGELASHPVPPLPQRLVCQGFGARAWILIICSRSVGA